MLEDCLKLSIIIPVYNPGDLIKRCLDSILAQFVDYPFEVLLVDDGSTDSSIEIIKSYQNPSFRLFRQKNSGPAVARNKGIYESKGEYISFIDADDYWDPTFIKKMSGFLDVHDECVAVACGQNHLTVSGNLVSPSCINHYCKPFIIENFFETNVLWDHVCTGSMMARSEAVKSIGGQREDLRITEDLEFWSMLSIKGKWGFVPDILFTSDGTDVIQTKEKWLKKMKVRWSNAPTIDVWQKRLLSASPDLEKAESFLKARGVISRNLTYCQLLSGRYTIARIEAKKYGANYTKDQIGKLMNLCKHSLLSWWLLCLLLKIREYYRFH